MICIPIGQEGGRIRGYNVIYEYWQYFIMVIGLGRIFPIVIILLVVASACVAPPKPAASNSSASSSKPGATSAVMTTPTPRYVTIETPYVTPTTIPPTAEVTATSTATPVPDVWVEIYRTKQYFSYNTTAFSYDLKKPPMLIHYYLQPVNVTGKKVIVKHYGLDIETTETISYEYYSPYSWFEVVVRDKNTGQVFAQDGFGNARGNTYSQNVNKTMKVYNTGELLIELKGNLMTATVDVQVKKDKNIA
jgi:hypothetical protein